MLSSMLDSIRAGEFGRLRSFYAFDGSEQEQAFEVMLTAAENGDRLDRALKDRFDRGIADASFGQQARAAGFELDDIESVTADDYQIDIVSDTNAMVDGPGVIPGVALSGAGGVAILQDGQWKILIGGMPGMDWGQTSAIYRSLGEVMNDVAQRVERGEIDSFENFEQAFATAMQQAMMGAMGGG